MIILTNNKNSESTQKLVEEIDANYTMYGKSMPIEVMDTTDSAIHAIVFTLKQLQMLDDGQDTFSVLIDNNSLSMPNVLRLYYFLVHEHEDVYIPVYDENGKITEIQEVGMN